MKIIKLMSENLDVSVEEAAKVLRAGGVVLYPTDTLYGLGVDAFSNEAVDKIYAIKGRPAGKPIHCVVESLKVAEEYGVFDPVSRALAKEFFPGPLTIVVEKKQDVQTGVARNIETIGFRIPDNEFCIALAKASKKPYTTTSANVSGQKTQLKVSDVLEQLGEKASGIDLIIDAGELPPRPASTVVGVSESDYVVIRDGQISDTEIAKVVEEKAGL